MIKTYSLKTHKNYALSKNFKVSEFACKDGSDTVLIDDALIELLQKIRDHYGKPITINSAYRNPEYNKKIGGVSNSQHTKGTASDIVIISVQPLEVAQYAEYLLGNKGGIGLYPNFVHIDTREKRARWKNFGKEVSVSGFPGYKKPVQKLESGNDILWELMNGKYKVKITEVDRAVKALDKAKNNTEFNSLYWILYKLVNGNG